MRRSGPGSRSHRHDPYCCCRSPQHRSDSCAHARVEQCGEDQRDMAWDACCCTDHASNELAQSLVLDRHRSRDGRLLVGGSAPARSWLHDDRMSSDGRRGCSCSRALRCLRGTAVSCLRCTGCWSADGWRKMARTKSSPVLRRSRD